MNSTRATSKALDAAIPLLRPARWLSLCLCILVFSTACASTDGSTHAGGATSTTRSRTDGAPSETSAGTTSEAPPQVETSTSTLPSEPPTDFSTESLPDLSDRPLGSITIDDPGLSGYSVRNRRTYGDRDFWAASILENRADLGLGPLAPDEMKMRLDDLGGFMAGSFGSCWTEQPPQAAEHGSSAIVIETPGSSLPLPIIESNLKVYADTTEAQAAYEWLTSPRISSGIEDGNCSVRRDAGAVSSRPCELGPPCSLLIMETSSPISGNTTQTQAAVALVGRSLIFIEKLQLDIPITDPENAVPTLEELLELSYAAVVSP